MKHYHARGGVVEEGGCSFRPSNEQTTKREMLEAICVEFEQTIAHADWLKAGSKGMQVPFFGDFASCVQLPSVISKMRWWVREFRRVLGGAG